MYALHVPYEYDIHLKFEKTLFITYLLCNVENRPLHHMLIVDWSRPLFVNIYSSESMNAVSGQRRPWSDCADAQSDQGLRCRYMAKGPVRRAPVLFAFRRFKCRLPPLSVQYMAVFQYCLSYLYAVVLLFTWTYIDSGHVQNCLRVVEICVIHVNWIRHANKKNKKERTKEGNTTHVAHINGIDSRLIRAIVEQWKLIWFTLSSGTDRPVYSVWTQINRRRTRRLISVFTVCHLPSNIWIHQKVVKWHYENTPIQIYRKFHLQKLKIFRWKTLIFSLFLLKT